MKKSILFLAAAALAITGAFAFAPASVVGCESGPTYKFKTGTQATLPISQNLADYQILLNPQSTDCRESEPVFCTYAENEVGEIVVCQDGLYIGVE